MSRNPTVKRILKESAELATHPSPDFTASPLESDLYEWHFTLRGPPAPSPFAQGIYHGRIILPPAYPLKPPSFRFLTPTGRFEVNREICLSISGHHEETWQPAWGIRTALVAIRSFMDSDAKGQVGGMEASEEVRKRLAMNSRSWKCAACQRSNEEVLKEVEDEARANGEEGKAREEVPEELRLAYREELGKKEDGKVEANGKPAETPRSNHQDHPAAPVVPAAVQPQSQPAVSTPQIQQGRPPSTPQSQPQRTQQLPLQQRQREAPQVEGVPPWIDKAIYGILGLLVFLVWKKFVF